MPSVTKQTLKSKTKKPLSVVDRIAPITIGVGGIKLMLYGRGKTGKTRLACSFRKPLLLVGTEDGTRSVSKVPGVQFVRLENSTEIVELVDHARDNFKTIVLDTAGGLQDMILKEILGLSNDAELNRTWGMAQQKDWQICGMQLKEQLRKMLDLADHDNLDVVIIAHERNFNDEGGSELLTPTVGAALTPSASGWLNGACDYVCQTFIREGVKEDSMSVGGKSVKTTKKTGIKEYCLRIGAHPVYMAGFRSPLDAEQLPDVIVNPTYAKILKLATGEGNVGTD